MGQPVHFSRKWLTFLFVWLSLAAGAGIVRANVGKRIQLLCLWRGDFALLPAAERAAVCRRVARRTGAMLVSAQRWRAFLRAGGMRRLALLRLDIATHHSLGWSWREGPARAWRAGAERRCGPFRVSVVDAGLAAAARQVLRNIERCRG